MRIDELMGFIQTYIISLSILKESKSITLKASLNEKKWVWEFWFNKNGRACFFVKKELKMLWYFKTSFSKNKSQRRERKLTIPLKKK